MKTDTELKQDILAELSWDPAVKSTQVGVIVNDGVVTLTGHLDTYAQKQALERAVQRIEGVKAIAVEVDVKLAPAHKRSDSEIAQAIERALQWHSQVDAEHLKVSVEHGWVTLRGDVDWDYQRRSVEKTIRLLTGVTGITNLIALKRLAKPEDVTRRIQDALARQAAREAKRIEVGLDGSTVTLRGRVHSWQEREAAQGAAWSVPGVTSVVNELTVGS